MPTLLRKYGYRFHFFTSKPEGERPHIHVDGKGCLSKFWLDDISLVWQRGFNDRELAKIQRVVIEYQEQFLEAWEKNHG
ncbi:MAG: DUF4160 domain-containing protein [Pseudomonadota bacterium]